MIPAIDFGGNGPTLHFAHANGYPPEAYTPLFEHLSPHFHILAAPLRPLWPDSDPQKLVDWSLLADDLIQFLETERSEPVVGVGHSVGGTTTLIAALHRPDLFLALVLIDPVIVPAWIAHIWHLITTLGWGGFLHPLVGRTRRRKRAFTSTEAMFNNYREKDVFKRLSDHALQTYVDALARPCPDGTVSLRYPPEWEVQIYLTGVLQDPQTWRQLKTLQPPLLLLRAEHSNTFWAPTAKLVKKHLPQAEIHTIAASSHLLPLEKPKETAQAIEAFLQSKSAYN